MSSWNTVKAPLHPEGRRFVAIFALITAGLFYFADPLGWVGVVLTIWCAYFFRDPERVTPDADGLFIAPADGVVLPIVLVSPPKELSMGDKPLKRISIFMNVFNVHVNRSPVTGKVTQAKYIPGKFLDASLDKASEKNERQLMVVKTASKKEVIFVQIAGLVARRILCWSKEGDTLEAGERFGLIRFGSRVDVYLPKGVEPLVIEGQNTVAGETVLADDRYGEDQRTGTTE
jgi:phosphatidylserine decarboxylase